MDKYFAPDNAELAIVFQKGGGRMGKNAQFPFTIQFKADGKPAAVSPADVKAVLTGPAQVLCQTRGAANRYRFLINQIIYSNFKAHLEASLVALILLENTLQILLLETSSRPLDHFMFMLVCL